jgi:phosphatidate cytidylyltransferase
MAMEKMNNFWKRSFTGVIFILAILLSILIDQYAYLLVFGTIVLIGMLEFKKMLKKIQIRVQTAMGITTGMLLYSVAFFIAAKMIPNIWLPFIIPVIICIFISIFIIELFRKTKMPVINIAITILMPLYVVLPFVFLHFLAFLSTGQFDYRFLIGFFIIIWSNDTAAYLVGVNFGKKRLFERISPKKSWEGAIGGFIASLLSALILSYFFKDLSMIKWLITGGIISIMGLFGDLVESMLKRSVNKKDSGTILPGHGGVLDRFDSVTFAAPMVFCYLSILQHFNY